jgi:HNH endonuclease
MPPTVQQDELKTIEFALGSLSQDSADTAMRILADEMRRITQRGIQCMMLLGQVLLEIQDRDLWRGRWATWGAFLREGVPSYVGLSSRTAYDAMDLARSPVLAHLPAEQVNAIASVGNAKRIARLERTGEPVTTEIIQMAQNLPTQEFHRQTGATSGIKVQVWIQDPAAAAAMQRLVDALAGASAGALDSLVELLGSDKMIGYAGTNRDSRLDAIIGAMVTAVKEELETAQPQSGVPPEHDGHQLHAPETLFYERMTGLEIDVFHGAQQPFVAMGYVAGNGAHPSAFGSGSTVEIALEDLRDARLRAVILAKIQEQHFRCAGCDKALPLQGHHIIFRSHGGTDRPENIEAVCAKCHHKRHHRKFPVQRTDEDPIIDCLHEAMVASQVLHDQGEQHVSA